MSWQSSYSPQKPKTYGDPLYLASKVIGLQIRYCTSIITNILDHTFILSLYIITWCTINPIRYISKLFSFLFITYMQTDRQIERNLCKLINRYHMVSTGVIHQLLPGFFRSRTPSLAVTVQPLQWSIFHNTCSITTLNRIVLLQFVVIEKLNWFCSCYHHRWYLIYWWFGEANSWPSKYNDEL